MRVDAMSHQGSLTVSNVDHDALHRKLVAPHARMSPSSWQSSAGTTPMPSGKGATILPSTAGTLANEPASNAAAPSTSVVAIFVVETTSQLASHYTNLLNRYLIPVCHQIKRIGLKKTEFALVTYGGYPRWSGRTLRKTLFTFDVDLMIKWLSEIDCTQEEAPQDQAFPDAIMCVLKMFDGHRHAQDTQKYCIVVADSPICWDEPSVFLGPGPLVGKTCAELVEDLSKRHVYLSLMVPRRSSSHLKKVFTMANAWNESSSHPTTLAVTKFGELLGLSGLALAFPKEEPRPPSTNSRSLAPQSPLVVEPSGSQTHPVSLTSGSRFVTTKGTQQLKSSTMPSSVSPSFATPGHKRPPRIDTDFGGAPQEQFLSPFAMNLLSTPSPDSRVAIAHPPQDPLHLSFSTQSPSTVSSSSAHSHPKSAGLPGRTTPTALLPPGPAKFEASQPPTQNAQTVHPRSANDFHRMTPSLVRDSKSFPSPRKISPPLESSPTALFSSKPHPTAQTPVSMASTPSHSQRLGAPSPLAVTSTSQVASVHGSSSAKTAAPSGNQTVIWTGMISVESLPPAIPSPISFNAVGIHLRRSQEEGPNLSFMDAGSWPAQMSFSFREGNQTQEMKERLFRDRKSTTFILLPQDRLDSGYGGLADVLNTSGKLLVSMVAPGKLIVVVPHISQVSKRLVAVVLEPKESSG